MAMKKRGGGMATRGMGAAYKKGGPILEYGGKEKYSSRASMKKHEGKESMSAEAGEKAMRGGGIATRGKGIALAGGGMMPKKPAVNPFGPRGGRPAPKKLYIGGSRNFDESTASYGNGRPAIDPLPTRKGALRRAKGGMAKGRKGCK